MTSSWTALAGCPDAADYLTSSATKPRRQPDGGRSSEPRIQAVSVAHAGERTSQARPASSHRRCRLHPFTGGVSAARENIDLPPGLDHVSLSRTH